MPLMLDSVQGPVWWAGGTDEHCSLARAARGSRPDSIEIALVNNMPDLALEETEVQFCNLLQAAAGNLRVQVKLFSLPNIPRGPKAAERLSGHYLGITELWNIPFDAAIITGTEPRQSDLRREPYWPALADVLDWAEENTYSTVLSCLAAHAGVLHSDGVGRHRLGDKQFGVFDFRRVAEHALLRHLEEPIRFPHSRCNEVRADELLASGYAVLTRSAEAGVDLFVKKRSKSLFVHAQGHPEYGALTLLKEYRRDAKRYLTGERETYPTAPCGYFDSAASELLGDFRRQAMVQRCPSLMTHFPEAAATCSLGNTWQESAVCVYRNWLQYVAERKADAPVFGPVSRVGMVQPASTTQEIVRT